MAVLQERAAGSTRRRLLVRLALAGTLLVTAAVYFQALGFDFIADDHPLIVNNPAIRSWKFIPSYFATDVWHAANPHAAGTYYRPTLELWLLLNYTLFGVDPWFWHLTTLGLHLCCTLLVYLLALKLTKDDYLSVAAALLFGLHPVHIENVAWVLGVNELVLAVFLISSFLCYLVWRERGPDEKTARAWLIASLVLYSAALFAKETAVLGWVFVFAYEWLFPPPARAQRAGVRGYRERFSSAFSPAARYLLLAALYLCIRTLALKGLGASRNMLSLSTIVLTLPSVLSAYVKHLIWPVQMSPFYDYPFITAFTVEKVLVPAVGLGVLGIGLFWLSRKSPLVAFACVWLVVPLLILLDLRVFSEGAICRIHWLYLPSIGFCLLCALGLRTVRNRSAQALALAILALFMGYEIRSQAHYWASDWEAARRGLDVAPRNHLVQIAMAVELSRIGLCTEAIPYLTEVLSHREHYKSLVLLGECYEKVHMHREAEQYERQAIQVDPYDPEPRMELGHINEQQEHWGEAEFWIREALRLQVADRPEPHVALAEVLGKEGNLNEALLQLQKAAALDPQNPALKTQINAIRVSTTTPERQAK